jgi:hypothetical protein
MQMPKAGPYIVVSVLGDKYFIQDLLAHKVVDTRASNLSEFRYDPTFGLNPTEVAARNVGEFFVDKIVDHIGNVHRRSDMQFGVRWKGYTPDYDTWQPIKTVRETQAFLDYCREKKLSSLVSKRLKFSLAQSNATQLGSTRGLILRSTSGTLESYARFSPNFWVCTSHLGFREFSR